MNFNIRNISGQDGLKYLQNMYSIACVLQMWSAFMEIVNYQNSESRDSKLQIDMVVSFTSGSFSLISSMAYRRDECKCAIAFQGALAAVMSAMSAASYLDWHYAELCKSALAAVMVSICIYSTYNNPGAAHTPPAAQVLPAAAGAAHTPAAQAPSAAQTPTVRLSLRAELVRP